MANANDELRILAVRMRLFKSKDDGEQECDYNGPGTIDGKEPGNGFADFVQARPLHYYFEQLCSNEQ